MDKPANWLKNLLMPSFKNLRKLHVEDIKDQLTTEALLELLLPIIRNINTESVQSIRLCGLVGLTSQQSNKLVRDLYKKKLNQLEHLDLSSNNAEFWGRENFNKIASFVNGLDKLQSLNLLYSGQSFDKMS